MVNFRPVLLLASLAIAAVAVCQTAGLQANAPWPRFQGNNFNTGQATGAGSNGVMRWKNIAQHGNAIASPPAIAFDGTIYVVAPYTLMALDANANVKWTAPLSSSTGNTPTIGADGTIYVALVGGLVQAINPDGTQKWITYTENYIASNSAVAIGPDGTVYVGDQSNLVYALNPDNGITKWTYGTHGPINSSLAVGPDGTIYVASGGYLQAIDSSLPHITWMVALSGTNNSAPVIGPDGRIYVWSNNVAQTSPALYVAMPPGSLSWEDHSDLVNPVGSPSLSADGILYIADYWNGSINNDWIDQFDTSSNKYSFYWGVETSDWNIVGSPVIGGDGTIYVSGIDVTTSASGVFAFRPSNIGTRPTALWTAYVDSSDQITTSPAIAADGTIYVGTAGGSVYAFGTIPTSVSVKSLTIAPSSVAEGGTATATVTLVGPAPTGGDEVSLSSNNAAAQLGPSVVIPAGSTTGTFTIYTSQVAANTTATATITASSNGASATATLSIQTVQVSSVTLDPTSVVAGSASTGTITLNGNAPSNGIVVNLSSSNNGIASPTMGTVNVPGGKNSATFKVTTSASTTGGSAVITGTVGSSSQSATLTVAPIGLASLSISPNSVEGGVSTKGTLTLNGAAPSGGLTVNLSSSSGSAQTPSSVQIAGGQSTATFIITTSAVTGTNNVTISAKLNGVTQTASLTVAPLELISLVVNPTTVVGGDTDLYGILTLNGPAPTGGVIVHVSSSSADVKLVNGSVVIPAGSTNTSFPLEADPVRTTTTATITATLGSVSRSATLTVTPPGLQNFSVFPNPVTGGSTATGSVGLSGAAPKGGVEVTLKTNNKAVVVPASVTVAAGSGATTFKVTTSAVSSTTVVTITGTVGSASSTFNLKVNAPGLASVSLNPTTVIGLTSSTGTVTLSGPAPASGISVLIASSEGAATVPTSVKIPAGKTSVTFTVKTVSVAAQTVAKITASLGAASQSADLTINPPAIVSLTLSPAAVVGGDSSTGKVTIGTAAPAGGLVVSLSRSNTADSMVPATVTVPAGKTSATFTITTKEVTAQTTSTITAALGPTSKSASLTIKT